MNMPNKHTCQDCGAVIPATSTEKLCPACLLSGALASPGVESHTVTIAPRDSLARYGPEHFPHTFGDYRLLGLLGRGGMGTVYEAEEIATGRRVALKMLGQQLDSQDMRQRFLREGRLAAGVNHPNSLYVFGSEEIEGLPVITMEIADSGTLKDRLKQRGPLPVTEAVDAVLDIIAGLEAAFTGGVLHRDIKPSNCFVSKDGSVKVGDFGLSVSTLSRTDTFVTAHGKIMGTPAYASPEQLRGDTLDVRADIYSVGATLYTLLTNRPPFEGDNAVQVVANAIQKKPTPLTELRDDVPSGLDRVVTRCLAKEPERRYTDYHSLRNALLPFSSRVPEPASMKRRTAAGWIDYLSAFLVPYIALMFSVGAVEFHVQPFLDRTLYAFRYHIAFLCIGILYFAVMEGFWGAGLGKRLKGLQVVRTDGRRPGFVRALMRIAIPILVVEGSRIPFLMATLSARSLEAWNSVHVLLHIGVSNVCPWMAVLLTLGARRENGFATVWDRLTGTRVVVIPKSLGRASIPFTEIPSDDRETQLFGPYRVTQTVVPETWLAGTDPVLRRPVWLLQRTSSAPSAIRRSTARQGRLRWLQKVEVDDATWDVFEAPRGVPFSRLTEEGTPIPWFRLRHWLHDLAAEMWAAIEEKTLLVELSLDHVWITTQGQAVLLDVPWPVTPPAERIDVQALAGQQRFLSTVAAYVESTTLPLHARSVLQNLATGKFEKLSFLTGTLRGHLDRPADVSRGIRAGSLFMLPVYISIMIFVGYYQDEVVQAWQGAVVAPLLFCILIVLGIIALVQLLELPLFGTIPSHSIFRLAVIDARGKRAGRMRLMVRWLIVWLPLLPAFWLDALSLKGSASLAVISGAVLLLWIGAAAYAVFHPHRGWQDHLAGTWVVRR